MPAIASLYAEIGASVSRFDRAMDAVDRRLDATMQKGTMVSLGLDTQRQFMPALRAVKQMLASIGTTTANVELSVNGEQVAVQGIRRTKKELELLADAEAKLGAGRGVQSRRQAVHGDIFDPQAQKNFAAEQAARDKIVTESHQRIAAETARIAALQKQTMADAAAASQRAGAQAKAIFDSMNAQAAAAQQKAVVTSQRVANQQKLVLNDLNAADARFVADSKARAASWAQAKTTADRQVIDSQKRLAAALQKQGTYASVLGPGPGPIGAITTKAPGDISRTAKAMQDLGRESEKTNGALQKTYRTLLAFSTGYLVISGVGMAFRGLNYAIFGYNSMLEQSRIAFTNLMGDSTKAADSLLNKLEDFARVTPFEFKDLVPMARNMVAMGVVTKETAERDMVPSIAAVTGAVARLGGGAPEIDRIVRALGQMSIKGKASAEEVTQQLGELVPAIRYIAEAMNVSQAQVFEYMKKGMVDGKKAAAAILYGMQQDAKKSLEEQSKTWQGAMGNIKDAATAIIAAGFEPMFKSLSKTAQGIAELAKTKAFQAWAKNMVETVTGGIMALGKGIAWLYNQAVDKLPYISGALLVIGGSKIFNGLRAATLAVVALGTGTATAAQRSSLLLGVWIAGVMALIAAYRNFPIVRTIVANVVNGVVDMLSEMSIAVAATVESISGFLTKIPDSVLTAIPGGGGLGVLAIKKLMGDQKGLADSVDEYWQGIKARTEAGVKGVEKFMTQGFGGLDIAANFRKMMKEATAEAKKMASETGKLPKVTFGPTEGDGNERAKQMQELMRRILEAQKRALEELAQRYEKFGGTVDNLIEKIRTFGDRSEFAATRAKLLEDRTNGLDAAMTRNALTLAKVADRMKGITALRDRVIDFFRELEGKSVDSGGETSSFLYRTIKDVEKIMAVPAQLRHLFGQGVGLYSNIQAKITQSVDTIRAKQLVIENQVAALNDKPTGGAAGGTQLSSRGGFGASWGGQGDDRQVAANASNAMLLQMAKSFTRGEPAQSCAFVASRLAKAIGLNVQPEAGALRLERQVRAKGWVPVDLNNLQRGDLIFNNRGGAGSGLGHVKMYAGAGQVVNSSRQRETLYDYRARAGERAYRQTEGGGGYSRGGSMRDRFAASLPPRVMQGLDAARGMIGLGSTSTSSGVPAERRITPTIDRTPPNFYKAFTTYVYGAIKSLPKATPYNENRRDVLKIFASNEWRDAVRNAIPRQEGFARQAAQIRVGAVQGQMYEAANAADYQKLLDVINEVDRAKQGLGSSTSAFIKEQRAETVAVRASSAFIREHGYNSLEMAKHNEMLRFQTELLNDERLRGMMNTGNEADRQRALIEVAGRMAAKQQTLNEVMRQNAFIEHSARVKGLDQEYASLTDRTIEQIAQRRMLNREDYASLSPMERQREIMAEVRNETVKLIVAQNQEILTMRQSRLEAQGRLEVVRQTSLSEAAQTRMIALRTLMLQNYNKILETTKNKTLAGIMATRITMEQMKNFSVTDPGDQQDAYNKIMRETTNTVEAQIAAQKVLLSTAYDSPEQKRALYMAEQESALRVKVTENILNEVQARQALKDIMGAYDATATTKSLTAMGEFGQRVAKQLSDAMEQAAEKARALQERYEQVMSDIGERALMRNLPEGVDRDVLKLRIGEWKDFSDIQKDVLEQMYRIDYEQSKIFGHLEEAVNGIRDSLVDAFAGIREKGLSSFGDLFRGILDRFNQMAAQILADELWKVIGGFVRGGLADFFKIGVGSVLGGSGGSNGGFTGLTPIPDMSGALGGSGGGGLSFGGGSGGLSFGTRSMIAAPAGALSMGGGVSTRSATITNNYTIQGDVVTPDARAFKRDMDNMSQSETPNRRGSFDSRRTIRNEGADFVKPGLGR